MSFFNFGGTNDNRALKAVALGVAVSVAVSIIMLCVISAVTLFMPSIPYDFLGWIALAAYAVGIFSGSYIAAATAGSKGLVMGLICAAAVFLISLIAGFAMDGGTLTVMTVSRLAVLLIFGAFGGIKGVNRRERVRIR